MGRPIGDHVDEGALLAYLHRRSRDGDRIFRPQREPRRDEGAGPKELVLVRHRSADHRHARGAIHRVLDHADRPRCAARFPGDDGLDRHVAGRQGRPHIGERRLRDRERDIDRRDLVDGRDRHDVGHANQIADLHVRLADAPADRRADGAVAQLHLEIIDERLARENRRAKHVHLSAGIVEIDLWGRLARHQLGIAPQVALGAGELGLIACKLGFGLADLRFDRPGIEAHEQVALLHQGAVGEMNADDLAVDSRAHRDAGERRHGSQPLDDCRHAFLDRVARFDRHDARLRRPRRLRGRVLALAEPLNGRHAAHKRHHRCRCDKEPRPLHETQSFSGSPVQRPSWPRRTPRLQLRP